MTKGHKKKSSVASVQTIRQSSRDPVLSAPPDDVHSHQLSKSKQLSRDDLYRSLSRSDSEDGLERLNQSIEADPRTDSLLADVDDEGYNSLRKSATFNVQLIKTAFGSYGPCDHTALKVRGPNYLSDSEKIAARAPVFNLIFCDVLQSNQRIFHIAQRTEFIHKYTKVNSNSERLNPRAEDFHIIVNFLVPSKPNYNLMCVFKRKTPQQMRNDHQLYDNDLDLQALQAFDGVLNSFVQSNEVYRNARFKLIPAIVDGANWFVKKTVGNKPAIIGAKIATTYYEDVSRNYLEIDIDVGSSSIGSGIFKVVSGYAKSVTLDMSFLIEGQSEAELPEVLIGGVRLSCLDVTKATKVTT